MREAVIERFVIISGCSSGGKSTLLAELQLRGFATVEEPGRRIVREELRGDGSACPGSMLPNSRAALLQCR